MRRLASIALLAASMMATAWLPAWAADPPTDPYVVRSTVMARAKTTEGYWKSKERAFDRWSWLPDISFQLQGPLTAGTQVLVDFYRPDGKYWLTYPMESTNSAPPEMDAEESADMEHDPPSQAQEALSLMEGGLVKFQIRISNELTGANKVLFGGRMKVQKAHSGVPGPNFQNHFVYYNDYDWLASVGWISQNTVYDADAPRFELYTWLKGPKQDSTQVKGYLFYKGKQIGSTNGDGYGTMRMSPSVQIRNKDDAHTWVLQQFSYSEVLGYYKGEDSPPEGTHVIANNPGDYEFKVIRNGQLVRSAKFTVQENGYLASTGFIEPHYTIESGLTKVSKDKRQFWMFTPMTVHGTQDGPLDLHSAKTEMWWGHP